MNKMTSTTAFSDADSRLRPDTSAMRREIPQASHIPGAIYTSPAIFALEKERIFGKKWLCAARSEEVAKVGDYLTLNIAGEPIVIAHDKKDGVVAFLNMCLHRGVAVAQGEGNAARFVCPYHAWTYDTGGNLMGAPMSRESGVDTKNCRLPRLRLAEWRGWIFVNFDSDAEPLETVMAPWEEELWFYRAGECKIAFKRTVDLECNWKFVVENVMDFLHAYAVHGASFGTQFNFKDSKLPFRLLDNGGVSTEFDTTMRKNFPLIFPIMPWLADKPNFAAGKAAIFPNMNLFANQESIRTSMFWPIGPDKMRLVLYFLMPEGDFALPDFDKTLDFYRNQVTTIIEEDRGVLEALQRAAASSQFRPGPLLNMERGIQHMITHYLDVMAL